MVIGAPEQPAVAGFQLRQVAMADNSTSAASARTGGEKAAPQEPGQQQPPLATEEFHREKHIKFFQRCLMMLPSEAQSLDTSRTTLVYFCVAGLDLLNALEPLIAKDKINPAALIDWIYAMQVRPDPSAADPTAGLGFRGAPHLGQPYLPAEGGACRCCKPDTGSLAHTYTAILTLAILGDDFGRLERAAIVKTLHSYQLPDGSFVSHPDGGEADMRYVYCACCIAYMLDDWGSIDRDAVVRFVRNSLCYDAGIAQAPDLESHAGSTLCALASLQLMVPITPFYSRLFCALSSFPRVLLFSLSHCCRAACIIVHRAGPLWRHRCSFQDMQASVTRNAGGCGLPRCPY